MLVTDALCKKGALQSVAAAPCDLGCLADVADQAMWWGRFDRTMVVGSRLPLQWGGINA